MDTKPQNKSIPVTEKPIAAFLLSTLIHLILFLFFLISIGDDVVLQLFTEDDFGLPVQHEWIIRHFSRTSHNFDGREVHFFCKKKHRSINPHATPHYLI